MYMKNHILAALRQEFNQWEEVLAGLNEAQIKAVPQPAELSIKDEIAHLSAWQQRSIARIEAALHSREPELPQWLPTLNPDDEGNTDQTNTWIYETYREQPWPQVQQNWREGYLRLLELAEAIPEMVLLDSSRFTWLKEHALASILVASYDHHQEHLEKLLGRLDQSKN